ncbi:MAG: HAMP domain-containing histidine kinase [Bacteroidales bacterium]|nr:HAMP domain-containing histidine kinase [Bacteroidales bacterium]
MRQKSIRLTIILGIVSIIGIIGIEIYLLQQNFNIRERQLNQSIHIALSNVAEILADYNNSTLPYGKVVYQYSPDYYVVNVNEIISTEILEHYLKKELSKRNINLDFEYGIYDCHTNRMVYGNYVKMVPGKNPPVHSNPLPTYDEYTYYFGVYFPDRKPYLLQNMGIWYLLTCMVIVVIIFFGYTQMVILKQRRLSETQKDFIDNLTHEFKTPLSSLKLTAEVLSDTNIVHEPERIITYSKILNDQSQLLIDHVDRVLKMTRLETHRLKLNLNKVDLHTILAEVTDGFTPRIKQHKGTLKLVLGAKRSSVLADETFLKNVLFNLLDNALKYTTNIPAIEVSTVNFKQTILLTLKDNGIGIPRKFQKKIFNRFYRVPTGNIHNVKGFGLGLSYVKKIVKIHKWKISIKSEVNAGTAVSIKIPLV